MPATIELKPEDTKLFSLYIHELWWLAHGIKEKTERIFAAAAVRDEGDFIQVNPELHSLIAAVISEAANLKKLLVTPSTRLDRESGRQFRLRRGRTLALAKLLEGICLDELLNPKVRNTLEHFGEYLDEANLAISEAQNPPSPIAAYNMVLSRWEVFSPRVYPIRLYISSERKFYNMRWSVDLDAMNKEACAVLERLKTSMWAEKEGPGGLMLDLTSSYASDAISQVSA